MYKISEFSKITGLPAKTLRYYDEEDSLKPSVREENGYRYYDSKDFDKAQLIIRLRELEFTIAEMKEIVSHIEKKEDLNYYIAEKQEMVKKRIEKDRLLVKRLEAYLNPARLIEEESHYEIVKKELAAMTVAAMHYQGKYNEVGRYIGTIYKEVKGQGAGMPFNCYFDEGCVEQADIMVCVPIKGEINAKETVVERLPQQKVLSVIHHGDYEHLNIAYKAILDYAKKQQLKLLVPSREIYIKGPGMIFKGNPNHYVTEIQIPYEEEEKSEQL